LIGAPPGYVGYEEGGQLTEKVRRKPYSVVLLDEIEKAHRDIFSILLQVMDDGQLTDGLGRKVDFKNTLIIMTANIGIKDMERTIKFGMTEKAKQEHDNTYLQGAIKKVFAPEFLNRIDDIVVFQKLEKEHIFKIIDITLGDLYKRLEGMGYSLILSEEAKEFVSEKGFDPQFGARPLHRAIQKYIEDPLAEFILSKNPAEGSIFKAVLDKKDNKLKITLSKDKTKKSESKK